MNNTFTKFTIFWTLLRRIIKKTVLDEARAAAKLSKTFVLNKENTLSPIDVDVGFACKIIVQEAEAKKKASPLQVLEFKKERIVLLQKLRNKLLERCTYILLDGLSYNTRGYFASCVVFFRAPQGRGKMRAMSKMFASITC